LKLSKDLVLAEAAHDWSLIVDMLTNALVGGDVEIREYGSPGQL
jgi:hypothetical protein